MSQRGTGCKLRKFLRYTAAKSERRAAEASIEIHYTRNKFVKFVCLQMLVNFCEGKITIQSIYATDVEACSVSQSERALFSHSEAVEEVLI